MNTRCWRIGLVSAVGLGMLAAVMVPAPAGASPRRSSGRRSPAAVCSRQGGAVVHCEAYVVTSDGVTRAASTTPPSGAYGPADLASAYQFRTTVPPSSWTWNGRTIAIADAYDNPNVAGDLAAYRSQYGLPPCTVASGCLTKISQSGSTTRLPAKNVGWGEEIDLDVQMASAVCPLCKILLVEASNTSITNLGAAVNQAASRGASVISNSYATAGELGTSFYDFSFNHPGIAITAASGDSGYQGAWPADIGTVIAVGGTSLVRDGSTGWTETAWSGAGSWCSNYESQKSWQVKAVHDAAVTSGSGLACTNRTVADVSAVADPATGVAVYDSYGSSGGANWYQFGGTSVATPIIASLYALAGDHLKDSANPYPAQFTYNAWYANPSVLNDPASGSNNATCNGDPKYLCTAEAGYDGPTGIGTPHGLGGF